MKPMLHEGEFVFCTFDKIDDAIVQEAICMLKETEGFSVILPRKTADERNYEYSFVSAWITLMVHSSLDAVGLTAAVSKALAEANISCNVVAGFHHDHVFVARKDGERAMRVLEGISRRR